LGATAYIATFSCQNRRQQGQIRNLGHRDAICTRSGFDRESVNSPPGATIPPRRREFRRQNAHNACGHDTDTTAALYVPAVHNGVNRNASDAVNRSRAPATWRRWGVSGEQRHPRIVLRRRLHHVGHASRRRRDEHARRPRARGRRTDALSRAPESSSGGTLIRHSKSSSWGPRAAPNRRAGE
jgi:hypothetical protein